MKSKIAVAFIILCCAMVESATLPPEPASNSSESDSVSRVIVQALVQSEVLYKSMGMNTSFSMPTNDSTVERRTQVTDAAILKLWADLRTSAKALQLLKEVVAAEVLADADSSYSDTIVKLDRVYSSDPILGSPYALLKKETNRTHQIPELVASHFGSVADSEEPLEKQLRLMYGAILGAGIMLLRFMQEMDANQNYTSVGHAYLELAQDPKLYEKIQNIFDRTRMDVALQSYDKDISEQASLLFYNLKKNIVDDVDVKKVLEKKKIVLPDINLVEENESRN